VSHYRSEHISADHDLESFDSATMSLDDWLRRAARHAEAANTGRTFVWVESGSQIVVGYFTLAAHLLRRADAAKGIGRGSPDVIPAILLARLALDRSVTHPVHKCEHGQAASPCDEEVTVLPGCPEPSSRFTGGFGRGRGCPPPRAFWVSVPLTATTRRP
jgi:hypothetical protein